MSNPRNISSIAFGVLGIACMVIALIAIGMRGQRTGSVQEMGKIQVAQLAPDFTLNDLDNQPVTLSSLRGKKVVLLDFWATWCGPCQAAMPGLQGLQDRFKNQGLEVLSIDQHEEADVVRRFIAENNDSLHVVLDSGGEVGGGKYGVRAFPTLVLVDKKGYVQRIQVGYSPNDGELTGLIDRLTKE